MPKRDNEQAGLPMLFKQLAGDGARVAEAELALARAEVAAIIRGYAVGITVGILGMTMAVTTLVVLSQAGAIALMPYVTNPAYAYLSVGLFLAGLTIALALIAGSIISQKHQPVGVILKWLTGESITK